jgi:para-nitrobenzyl esterase
MRAHVPTSFAALLLAITLAPGGAAQQPPVATEVGGSMLALVTLKVKDGTKLTVTSPAFSDGGDIPFENTQYRGNVFPGLEWTRGPALTKSYVVIMQDADFLVKDAPVLHWTMGNIPAAVTKLNAGMSAPPDGAQYGPNVRGPNHAYMGPRTPAGPKHRYHFQIFALDKTLAPDAFATYESLTAAMKGHVLASGEVVGLGQFAPQSGS